MQHRGLRFGILCLLLAAGGSAGFYVWTSTDRVQRLDDQQRVKEDTIDRLQSSIVSISAAQQASRNSRGSIVEATG